MRSRYKLLGDSVIVPGYCIAKRHWRSVAMEIGPKAVCSHGTRFILRAAAGSASRIRQPAEKAGVRVHRYAGPGISGQ